MAHSLTVNLIAVGDQDKQSESSIVEKRLTDPSHSVANFLYRQPVKVAPHVADRVNRNVRQVIDSTHVCFHFFVSVGTNLPKRFNSLDHIWKEFGHGEILAINTI